jgi:hypothetical protein
MTLGYFEAWERWSAASLRSDDILFAVSIRSWGRIGKLFEFVAAVILLWDALSSSWLSRIGLWWQRFHKSMTFKCTHAGRHAPPEHCPDYPAAPWGAEMAFILFLCAVFSGLFLAVAFLLDLVLGEAASIALLQWLDATFVRRLFIELPLLCLLMAATGLIILKCIASPTVWSTSHFRVSFVVRMVAFIGLCIGLHFTLLAM